MDIPKTTPKVTLEDLAAKEGEFTFELSYYPPDEASSEAFSLEVSSRIFDIIKEKVKREIPNLLTFANFIGEAEEYMRTKGIPYSPKVRQDYAIALRNDFMASLDDMLVLDKENKSITISPFLLALEHGDFYRPAVRFLSVCIEQWIKELEKAATDSE